MVFLERGGLSFQPYFLLLMVVITGSLLSGSIYAHTRIVFTCGHISERSDVNLCGYIQKTRHKVNKWDFTQL